MEKKESEELKVSIHKKLRRAINEGDKEKALTLLDEIEEVREKHDGLYLTWVDMLLTYIADKLGEETVYDFMRNFSGRVALPILEEEFGPVSIEDRVRHRAYMWNTFHGIDIDEIEEDEEKFIFKFKCPSGGRINTWEHCGRTEKAYPWSWGQKGLSYYCAHHSVLDIMAIEQFGYTAWVTMPQEEGRCIQYVYKNPDAVPEEYYRSLGMEKKSIR